MAENVKNRRVRKVEFSMLRFWGFWTGFSGQMGLFTHKNEENAKKFIFGSFWAKIGEHFFLKFFAQL